MEMEPDNNIGYWLFYAQRYVSNAFAEVLKGCCEEHGKPYVITPPQWGVLETLHREDGLTVGVIASLRRVDAPTVTGIITRLQQSGLVRRVHDEQDRRTVRVYLTAEAREITAALYTVSTRIGETMLQGFSEAEQQAFLANLQRLVSNLAGGGAKTEDRLPVLQNVDAESYERQNTTKGVNI